MSDDVTIPREEAKSWAAFLRRSTQDRLNPDWRPLADLLDPPPPSLRDEMVAAHAHVMGGGGTVGVQGRAMDAALAVVRKRIEAMPERAYRDDVLALLGGDR